MATLTTMNDPATERLWREIFATQARVSELRESFERMMSKPTREYADLQVELAIAVRDRAVRRAENLPPDPALEEAIESATKRLSATDIAVEIWRLRFALADAVREDKRDNALARRMMELLAELAQLRTEGIEVPRGIDPRIIDDFLGAAE